MPGLVHAVPRLRAERARCVRVVLSLSVLLAGVCVARPGSAFGAAFQRGDVFVTGIGNVQEYSPSGQLIQTLAESSGAGGLCFNPDGTRLIVPGVGLFSSSGDLVASSWASVPTAAHSCVADGSGDVYLSAGTESSWTITRYSILGEPERTFDVAGASAFTGGPAIDLAPDECTIDYGEFSGPVSGGIFNVCTDKQISSTSGSSPAIDDLSILPNGQVLLDSDYSAELYSAGFAQRLQIYTPPPTVASSQWWRYLTLDPDGTSFWTCCSPLPTPGPTPINQILRLDFQSGKLLSQWTAPGLSPIAAYGPPLLGDADLGRTADSDAAGTAEAFRVRARFSGALTDLHLYVPASSTASAVDVGIYAGNYRDPTTLLAHASISAPRPGSWNEAGVPSVPITAGRQYWIAVLAPAGAGTIDLRDESGRGASETSAQSTLTALPVKWSGGASYHSGALSAYGS